MSALAYSAVRIFLVVHAAWMGWGRVSDFDDPLSRSAYVQPLTMVVPSLRVLLIGNGGREHALAWKLSQSSLVTHIYAVPGNGGTARVSNTTNVSSINPCDFAALVLFAREHQINFLLPGPEQPLVDGIVDYFEEHASGIRIFGPSKAAARMEGSKTYAKDFMHRHRIPTAEYRNFSAYEDARRYLDTVEHNIVIKAAGLAAGKGVIIPRNKQEALDALKEIMLDKEFGDAGNEVVIEEFLEGEELSILGFCDGYTVRSLPPAQDHKRIHDGDQGPNTGGMGCYAPTKIASKGVLEEIHRTILQPTIDGMRKERFPMVGCLFTGLIVTESGPKVLEYNVRFGDPETQTLLPLFRTDLAEVLLACACGYLDAIDLRIQPNFSATVVVASSGYPGPYSKGTEITLSSASPDTVLFHAGTSFTDNTLRTSGGRVIAATSTGSTIEEAVEKAYVGVKAISFEGMHYRKDIAHRAFSAHGPTSGTQESLTYAMAGVSIDAGNSLVSRIKAAVATTRRPGAEAIIGGFGGVLDLAAAGYDKAPILVQAIDGVGTKLKIAFATGKHDTVGIDLVAMNVNDLIVQGAEPLSFLDYFACSKLDVETAASFVEGVAEGCRQAGCALIGGETAEMPGLYSDGEYDAAGEATGAIRQGQKVLPDLDGMRDGDVLLGLASNGPHSNGYSLIRRILERSGLAWDDVAPWEKDRKLTVGESLLTPTRIYVKSLLKVVEKGVVKGMAHITGGGLYDNVPRMLPKHLAAEMDVSCWPVPDVFRWLKKEGNVTAQEFGRTFNTGLGMVLVVGTEEAPACMDMLRTEGETVYEVGRLIKREQEGCFLRNLENWD